MVMEENLRIWQQEKYPTAYKNSKALLNGEVLLKKTDKDVLLLSEFISLQEELGEETSKFQNGADFSERLNRFIDSKEKEVKADYVLLGVN